MMSLTEAAKAIDAKYNGIDTIFSSVGTDSRNIQSGQLFIALKGDKFDGHDYVHQAIAQGAAAVMVCESHSSTMPVQALLVKDTYQALGQLASYWRSQMTCKIVAVTGSNGKTTVKEMLASILKTASGNEALVLATVGNLNNHIGVPLTLLKINTQHQYAVIEMGMNHRGEIAYLTNLTKPNVVVINNAGNAHLGKLGSMQAIAEAKGEIIEGLVEEGIVVLNADDVFLPLWKKLASKRKTFTFGVSESADVKAASFQLHMQMSQIKITHQHTTIDTQISSSGLHNVQNALAASAAALALGVSSKAIQEGLAAYQGAKGRLQYKSGINNSVVIDDTYNANPMSMQVAIDVLKTHAGKKILVLGDMGELGQDAQALHREIGGYAKAAGIQTLLTLGNMSLAMTQAFGAGAKHYDDIDDLVNILKMKLEKNTIVLVKGSRFMAMERVVNRLIIE